jgi:glycosyltransferase involved in cell wall biosynthesis
LIEEAQRLDLDDTVILPGSRRDIPEILALSDVFVLPSLWEGVPIALLEAMAAGLPVIATKVGGVPEVVVDGVTGILVPPADPDALAQAIIRVSSDAELRTRMGRAGQDRATISFDVSRMVGQTEALYEALLTEKGIWK